MGTYKFIVCVLYTGEGVFIDVPDEFKHHIDGFFCEENQFEGVPEVPGVYECDAEYWSDGSTFGSEPDWGWKVVDYKALYSLPSGHRVATE